MRSQNAAHSGKTKSGRIPLTDRPDFGSNAFTTTGMQVHRNAMTHSPPRHARKSAPAKVSRSASRDRDAAEDSALLALAVAQSPTVFYVAGFDGDQPIRFISDNIERITGHPPAAFLAEPGYGRRFIHPDDLESYCRHLATLSDTRSGVHEFRFRCTDGSYRWFRDQITLCDGSDGEGARFIGCMIDVTAEKQDRDSLQDALDSLQSAFAISDRDGRLILCNRAFAEDFGSTPENFVGVPREKIIGDFLDRVVSLNGRPVEDSRAEARRVIETLNGSAGEDYEIECTDGRWYLVTTAPTRAGGGVTVRTDITRQKQGEQAVRESEDLIRRILEACPLPISMTRAEDGIIIYESPASQRLYQRDSHRSTVSARAHFVNVEDRSRYVAELRRTGSIDGFEVELKRSDGSRFWGEFSARLIDYKGEEVIVSTTVDQTERRQVSQELERQREILHQSEKLGALGELLAGVAHELNNPLSVVVGQALMLRETNSDPAIAQRAEKIGKAADRCAKIVKTFLAMARQRPKQTKALSLNAVVDSALEVTSHSLRSAGVDIQVNLSDALPPVRGDADQLNQVLTNLIVNAQNAMQDAHGPRCLKINTLFRAGRGEVVLKVKDSGPGIPEAIRSRIFEPFFTTKDVGAGTGIGLAFCHRIVEAHGGRIKVASRPGEGATFVIALPAKPRWVEEEHAAAPPPRADGRLDILLIDDEADVREILGESLRGQGHSVEVAKSGGEALQCLGRRTYDVILSDLRMPGLDGPRLFNHLRDQAPELIDRLAFVTGDAMSPAVRSFLASAGRPYVEKPATPEDLADLIDRLVNTG